MLSQYALNCSNNKHFNTRNWENTPPGTILLRFINELTLNRFILSTIKKSPHNNLG